MEAAVKFATGYLEDVLSFFGLNTKVDASFADQTIELVVPSTHLNGFLIGSRGDNLRSLQHITNMALKRNGYDDILVTIDIAGYRKQKAERLGTQVKAIAEQVLASGKEQALEPMSAYDRRVAHSVVSEMEGLKTESVGEGRDRRVVIKKII